MNGFHTEFLRALFEPGSASDPAMRACAAQTAFAVYRNTVMKSCVDALEANFPVVAQLVGADWFRAAAAEFARRHPPTDGRLLAYGDAEFPAFVGALPTARDLPYLGAVARLDTLWRESHAASDAPTLDAEVLAATAPHALGALVAHPHPAARWIWFDGMPAATIWSRTRRGVPPGASLDWDGDGLLLTRAEGAVRCSPLSASGCAFLDACRDERPLGEAAGIALGIDASTDVAELLHMLLRAGAFTDRLPTSKH